MYSHVFHPTQTPIVNNVAIVVSIVHIPRYIKIKVNGEAITFDIPALCFTLTCMMHLDCHMRTFTNIWCLTITESSSSHSVFYSPVSSIITDFASFSWIMEVMHRISDYGKCHYSHILQCACQCGDSCKQWYLPDPIILLYDNINIKKGKYW